MIFKKVTKARRLITVVAVTMISFALVGFVSVSVALADNTQSNKDSLAEKWLFIQYYHCLQSDELVTPLSRPASNSGSLANSVFNSDQQTMLMPSYSYIGTDQTISCREILKGANSLTGVFSRKSDIFQTSDPSWGPMADKMLETLGYTVDDANDAYYFTINAQTHRTEGVAEKSLLGLFTWCPSGYTQKVNMADPTTRAQYSSIPMTTPLPDLCLKTSVEQESSAEVRATRGSSGVLNYQVTTSGWDRWFDAVKIDLNNSTRTFSVAIDPAHGNLLDRFSAALGPECTSTKTDYGPFELKDDFNVFRNLLASQLQSEGANTGGSIVCKYMPGVPGEGDYNYVNVSYTFQPQEVQIVQSGTGDNFSHAKNAETAEASLTKFGKTLNSLKANDDEIYDLYLHYINTAIPGGTINRISCEKEDNLTKVHMKDADGKWRKYFMNLNLAEDSVLNGDGLALIDGNTIKKRQS